MYIEHIFIMILTAFLYYMASVMICHIILKKKGYRPVYAFLWGLLGVIGIVICAGKSDVSSFMFTDSFEKSARFGK